MQVALHELSSQLIKQWAHRISPLLVPALGQMKPVVEKRCWHDAPALAKAAKHVEEEDAVSVVQPRDFYVDIRDAGIICLAVSWENSEEQNLCGGDQLPEGAHEGADSASDFGVVGSAQVICPDFEHDQVGREALNFSFDDTPKHVLNLVSTDSVVGHTEWAVELVEDGAPVSSPSVSNTTNWIDFS